MELRRVLKQSWQDDMGTLGRPWSWAFWALGTCWACSGNGSPIGAQQKAVLLAQWFSTVCPLPAYQPRILSCVRRAMSQQQRWCSWHPASWGHKHLQCTGQSPPQTYRIQSARWAEVEKLCPKEGVQVGKNNSCPLHFQWAHEHSR